MRYEEGKFRRKNTNTVKSSVLTQVVYYSYTWHDLAALFRKHLKIILVNGKAALTVLTIIEKPDSITIFQEILIKKHIQKVTELLEGSSGCVQWGGEDTWQRTGHGSEAGQLRAWYIWLSCTTSVQI